MEEIENGEMEQDTLGLPEEWMHCCMGQASGEIGLNCLVHKEDQPDTEKSQTTVVVPQEEQTQNDIEENEALQEDQVQKRQAKTKKKKVWGPIQPERRSKRQPQDGVPVLERAQALRMKNNLEVPEGITNSSYHLTSQILSDLAVKVGLEVEDGKDRNRSCIESIVEDNAKRSEAFSVGCSFANCRKNKVSDRPPSIVTRSMAAQKSRDVTVGNIVSANNSIGTHTTEGSVNSCDDQSVSLEADPSTLVSDRIDDSNYDLADLVEEAWTKVGSRKKK
jgi:hypothetical protein